MRTEEQSAVITHTGGHAVVSAVAGSGKTQTMIHRILHLLQQGVDAKRILVMMFNKSAREDFVRRLSVEAEKLGLPTPEVFTFHGFGLRLCTALEKQGFLIESRLPRHAHDVLRLGTATLHRFNESAADGDKLDINKETVTEFLDIVDAIKGSLEDASSVQAAKVDKRYLKAFELFEEERVNARLRTFSDLIYDPVRAMIADTGVAKFVAGRYDHMILDEFQDINEAQMRLVRFVAGGRASVMAVGDDDQTIYGWRGARSEYMTGMFESIFPGAVRYSLSRTFRFGHRLSLIADHVIVNNTNRTDKLCVSGTDIDTQIEVLFAGADNGATVAKTLKGWASAGRRYSEVAVLVREYAHSASVEASFLRENIPYSIVGAEPFFDRTEILALRGCMQLACGGLGMVEDKNMLARMVTAMLTTPTLFLKRDQVEALVSSIIKAPSSFLNTVKAFAGQGQQDSCRRRLLDALETWRSFATARNTMSADYFLLNLVRSQDLYNSLTRSNPRADVAREKIHMVQSAISLARSGRHTVLSFADYLDDLSLRFAQETEAPDCVLITSIHRAKGMEWPHVVLVELAEGRFPSYSGQPSSVSEEEMEDERRLFYVASTRARERLTLIAPRDGTLVKWSQQGRAGHPDPGEILASRFLFEANIGVSILAGDAIMDGHVNPVPRNAGSGKAPVNVDLVKKYVSLLDARKQESKRAA